MDGQTGRQTDEADLVYLKIGCPHQVLLVMGAGNVGEDVFKGVWNDSLLLGDLALTSHRVGLTRPCLAIGKYSACQEGRRWLE